MLRRLNLLAPRYTVAYFLLAVALPVRADYDDPYGLKRQQREWQATSNHYDAWINDIRSRKPSQAGVNPNIVWQSNKERLREWNEWEANWKKECEAERERDRAWQEHLDEYSRQLGERNRQIAAENARIRAINEQNRDANHAIVRKEFGGMAPIKRPPVFASKSQEFNWYLAEAKGGDPYAAYWVGRALLEGIGVPRNEASAVVWLEKTNLEWGEPAALLGSVLVAGRGGLRDEKRGLELLERGSKNDIWGVGAWLAANVYASGAGTRADMDKAAFHYAHAALRSEQQNPWDAWTPRLAWGPPPNEWSERAELMRKDFKTYVYSHPEQIKWWVRQWRQDVIFEAQLLMNTCLAAPAEYGGKPQAAYLESIEAGESLWSDPWHRDRFLEILRERKHPDLAKHEAIAREQGKAVPFLPDFSPLRLRMEKRGEARTEAELDEARQELIAADKLPDGEERTKKLFSAFEKGDAMAAWPILDSDLKLPVGDDSWMARLMNDRLLRDVKGSGERAASAALTLYFLHDGNSHGHEGGIGSWRYIQGDKKGADQVDWLTTAYEKGHPWAIWNKGEFRGMEYAEAKERPAKWKLVESQLVPALKNEEWWRRDARLLHLSQTEDEISHAKEMVATLRAAQTDAQRFTEISTNLDAALSFCFKRAGTFGDDSRESKALLDKCFLAFDRDRSDGENLPFNRAKALQLSVEAATLGDGWAAFTVGEILDEAPYPYNRDAAQGRRWLESGRVLLDRAIKNPDRARANDAALFLGKVLLEGENLPRDTKAGLRYLEFAAVGGHFKAASLLYDIYEDGDFGVKKDATLAAKWDKVAGQIIDGTYKMPSNSPIAAPVKKSAAPKPAAQKLAPKKAVGATKTKKG